VTHCLELHRFCSVILAARGLLSAVCLVLQDSMKHYFRWKLAAGHECLCALCLAEFLLVLEGPCFAAAFI